MLDTCWPPNALFFTPDRLLIRATEVGAATKGGDLDPGEQFVRTVRSTDYTTSAPPALQAQGLTLQQNEAPMGTMNLVNASVAFAQSPGPLSLEAAALETYFGGLHAAAQHQAAWWAAMAPGVALPPQLAGAAVTGHDAPLDVEIDSSGGTPTQVVLRTTVSLSGGSASGRARHDGRSPCSRVRGHHRELGRQLSRRSRGRRRSRRPGPQGLLRSPRFHDESPGEGLGRRNGSR